MTWRTHHQTHVRDDRLPGNRDHSGSRLPRLAELVARRVDGCACPGRATRRSSELPGLPRRGPAKRSPPPASIAIWQSTHSCRNPRGCTDGCRKRRRRTVRIATQNTTEPPFPLRVTSVSHGPASHARVNTITRTWTFAWKANTHPSIAGTVIPTRRCRCCQKVSFDISELDQNCTTCHDDVHRGIYGVDCASCHGQQAPFRVVAAFEHSLVFPLNGAHAKAACVDCHSPDTPYAIRSLRSRRIFGISELGYLVESIKPCSLIAPMGRRCSFRR